MTMYSEDLDSFLDNLEFDESDERTRSRGGRRGQTPLRTPSPQSSFQPRPSANTVTQAQLQAAVRTLDGKITTLAGNVKTLETRTSSVAAEQDRVSAALRKEIEERKKSADGIRRDLQQTKTLAVLLPLISQKTEDVVRADGTVAKVVTQPSDSLSSILPFMLLMGGNSGDSASPGMLGDSSNTLLMMVLLSRR
jgi:predicted RNase H-like nuclease (RuvC/YqgF family)